ncbi:DUF1990 family protein, partial [Streptomyces sp. NPDC041003]|uniref:DUF1990 family protein n=1 Tax=Streptomyces sp. NPDC041003 TaxID=3155730 RepID=UPI0033C188D1
MTRLISAGRDTVNYPDRGATAHRPLPAGYHHLNHRTRLGHGRAVFEAAGTAVTTFRAHRTSGMRVSCLISIFSKTASTTMSTSATASR